MHTQLIDIISQLIQRSMYFPCVYFVNTYLSVMDIPCDPPAAAPRPLDTLFFLLLQIAKTEYIISL